MITNESLLKQLQWRYATKLFDPHRKLDGDTISALEESLVLTPSSFGLQPWKFLVIEDQAVKERLTPLSRNQPQVKDCSHFVVFTYNAAFDLDDVDRYLRAMVGIRGGSLSDLETFRNVMRSFIEAKEEAGNLEDWSIRQVYIALGQLMVSAAMLGVDACPMEGIQPADFDEVLKLKDTGFKTVVACALGYRLESDKYAQLSKVRFPKEELVSRI